MWLRVVSDHVRIVSDMKSPLLSYMQLQPIASSPFRSTVDPSVQRFGILWKLYMKAQMAELPHYVPLIGGLKRLIDGSIDQPAQEPV